MLIGEQEKHTRTDDPCRRTEGLGPSRPEQVQHRVACDERGGEFQDMGRMLEGKPEPAQIENRSTPESRLGCGDRHFLVKFRRR